MIDHEVPEGSTKTMFATRVAAALDRAGIRTTAMPNGDLVDEAGRAYPLDYLVSEAEGRPESDWDLLVEERVRRLTTPGQRDPQTLDDIIEMVRFRVLYRGGLPSKPASAMDLSDDLIVAVTVAYPDRIGILDDIEDLAPRRFTLDFAWANLRTLPRPEVMTWAASTGPGPLTFLTSRDGYGASRILVIDEILEEATGADPSGTHILFALPDHDSIVLHVITGPDYKEATSNLLDVLASRDVDLSQHLYYRAPDGKIHQLTKIVDGRLGFSRVPAFEDGLRDLGLLA